MNNFRKLLIVLALAFIAAAAIAIDIPCGYDLWPPCDLNPPTKGGGGN